MNSDFTFNIVLFNPQIPPNTGNILRLCKNTGCKLHLIEPLGFNLKEKSLKRAFMDYADLKEIKIYKSIKVFLKKIDTEKIFLITKFGSQRYDKISYNLGDTLIFGSEITGLSNEVYDLLKHSVRLYIPMDSKYRSLNLANAVSVCIYEALRQNNFFIS